MVRLLHSDLYPLQMLMTSSRQDLLHFRVSTDNTPTDLKMPRYTR